MVFRGQSVLRSAILFVSLVLSFAATSKAIDFYTQSTSGHDIPFLNVNSLALVGLEFVLAVGLAFRPIGMVSHAVVFFAAAAAYAAVLAKNRVASCGCFGGLQADPRLVFLFDLAAIAILVSFGLRNAAQLSRRQLTVSTMFCCMGVLIGTTAQFGFSYFSSQQIEGELIGQSPIASEWANERRNLSLVLANNLNARADVHQLGSTCTCTTIETVPVSLAAKSVTRIPITINDFAAFASTKFPRLGEVEARVYGLLSGRSSEWVHTQTVRFPFAEWGNELQQQLFERDSTRV